MYSCEKPWFQVSKGQRVYADQAFPLDFEVTVDTRRLAPNQTHVEWLEAVLDGMPVRIDVQVRVVPRQMVAGALRWRWLATGLTLLLVMLLSAQLFGFSGPAFDWAGFWVSAHPTYELRANEMLFAVQELNDTALYAGAEGGGALRRLGIPAAQAVGTVAGQYVAYLDGVGVDAQIQLFNLAQGKALQITHSSVEKSMLAWSADGLRLGYLVGEGDERQIGLFDVRSGQEYLLPGEIAAGVEHFAWSPDGQSLLFDLHQGDEQRVYRMGVHGEELRQLTHFDSWAGAWSGDGTQILVGTDHGLYALSSTGQQLRADRYGCHIV
ncbi:MAG: hypothetical protein R2867_45160 [Caldilineaceae bacterium]